MTKLFIYGTLKKGQCRNSALEGQTFLGEVSTEPNYKLYRVSSFPGIVPVKDGIAIKGELWEVDARCLAALDRIEGHPKLFKRDTIQLQGHSEPIESYFWQGSTDLPEIGDCWK